MLATVPLHHRLVARLEVRLRTVEVAMAGGGWDQGGRASSPALYTRAA
jgi:hypothetical protein